jgi:hypothetical protein
MPDFIPASDAEFDTWIHNFTHYVSAHLAELGLVAADLTPITDSVTDWDTAFADQVAALAAAQGASQTKNSVRAALEGLVRPLIKRMQSHPGVTNAHRASMSITVPSTDRTAAAVPESRPVGTIDTSQRLRHTINFSDESTPGRRGKPAGVTGCEIWVKIGDPAPVDPKELHFVAMDTATPYVRDYDGADGNKTAHYMLRWVNSKGESGPWSQTVSATITG